MPIRPHAARAAVHAVRANGSPDEIPARPEVVVDPTRPSEALASKPLRLSVHAKGRETGETREAFEPGRVETSPTRSVERMPSISDEPAPTRPTMRDKPVARPQPPTVESRPDSSPEGRVTEERGSMPKPAADSASTVAALRTSVSQLLAQAAPREIPVPGGNDVGQVATGSHSPVAAADELELPAEMLKRVHHRALAEAIVARARRLPQNGSVEVRFALEPKDLGLVRVRIESRGEQLRIRILASSGAAVDALSSGVAKLAAQLSEAGGKSPVIDLAVDDALGAGTQQRHGESNPGRRPNPGRQGIESPNRTPTRSTRASGRLDMMA
jgi:flagellar hook-length control protein FliK